MKLNQLVTTFQTMVYIREIFTAVAEIHPDNSDEWRTLKDQLIRAYYRTGQLDDCDWFYVHPNVLWGHMVDFPTNLHPDLVQHFYQRVLPTLSESGLVLMYLFRFIGQLTDATTLITGRHLDMTTYRGPLSIVQDHDVELAKNYDNLDPELLRSMYVRRVGETLVDVTEEMTALPASTKVSTIHFDRITNREPEEIQRSQWFLLDSEEEALLGSNIGDLMFRSVDGIFKLHTAVGSDELPEELPRITAERVTTIWKQLLADPKYLVQAYVRARQFELGMFERLRHIKDALRVEDIINLKEAKIEAKFLATLKTVPPHPVPAVAATLKYLRLLLENKQADEDSTLLPHQLDDADPVFSALHPSTSGSEAGEVPTDAVIQQRLVAL